LALEEASHLPFPQQLSSTRPGQTHRKRPFLAV
jgi:hypothetical protein